MRTFLLVFAFALCARAQSPLVSPVIYPADQTHGANLTLLDAAQATGSASITAPVTWAPYTGYFSLTAPGAGLTISSNSPGAATSSQVIITNDPNPANSRATASQIAYAPCNEQTAYGTHFQNGSGHILDDANGAIFILANCDGGGARQLAIDLTAGGSVGSIVSFPSASQFILGTSLATFTVPLKMAADIEFDAAATRKVGTFATPASEIWGNTLGAHTFEILDPAGSTSHWAWSLNFAGGGLGNDFVHLDDIVGTPMLTLIRKISGSNVNEGIIDGSLNPSTGNTYDLGAGQSWRNIDYAGALSGGTATVTDLTASGFVAFTGMASGVFQCLHINGAGDASGTGADCASANYWTLSGSNISYSAGNVGVGITSPVAPFSVLGQVSDEVARFQARTDASNHRAFVSLYTTNPCCRWEMSNEDPSGGGTTNGLAFRECSSCSTSTPRLYIAQGGHVMVGTRTDDGSGLAFQSPGASLSGNVNWVTDNTYSLGSFASQAASIYTHTALTEQLEINDPGGTTNHWVAKVNCAGSCGSNDFLEIDDIVGTPMLTLIRKISGSNVNEGIIDGSLNPSTGNTYDLGAGQSWRNIDYAGALSGGTATVTDLTASGFVAFTGMASGVFQCLQINGAGVASGTGAVCGSGGSSQWTTNASGIFYNSGGSVMVNTTSPVGSEKLTVNGDEALSGTLRAATIAASSTLSVNSGGSLILGSFGTFFQGGITRITPGGQGQFFGLDFSASGSAALTQNGTTRIDASGNLSVTSATLTSGNLLLSSGGAILSGNVVAGGSGIFAGTMAVTGGYGSGGVAGVSCSGSPTGSFASVLGIVTHC